MGCGVERWAFRASDVGFRVKDSGFRFQGSEFRVSGVGLTFVQNLPTNKALHAAGSLPSQATSSYRDTYDL